MDENISELVKKEVRPDGTLVLDKDKTSALIRWLTKVEDITDRYKILFGRFSEIMKEIK